MVLEIVTAVDGERDLELLEPGCELARRHRARISLVVGIPRPAFACCLGSGAAVPPADLEAYSRSLVDRALDAIADDLSVTWRQVHGSARRHVLATAGDLPGRVLLLRDVPLRERRTVRRCSAPVVVAAPAARAAWVA